VAIDTETRDTKPAKGTTIRMIVPSEALELAAE
jgi:hypothetical protein